MVATVLERGNRPLRDTQHPERMQVAYGHPVVELAAGLGAQRQAAGIWARATVKREYLPSVP
ncbi:hypothetical protein [Kineococcus sp. SYSU DK006]|uniref:hypothetical protein n=1 Tax=Kineococcus sp. SYSU DK006 TaxID=3383127 RepID=UPI003D7ED431